VLWDPTPAAVQLSSCVEVSTTSLLLLLPARLLSSSAASCCCSSLLTSTCRHSQCGNASSSCCTADLLLCCRPELPTAEEKCWSAAGASELLKVPAASTRAGAWLLLLLLCCDCKKAPCSAGALLGPAVGGSAADSSSIGTAFATWMKAPRSCAHVEHTRRAASASSEGKYCAMTCSSRSGTSSTTNSAGVGERGQFRLETSKQTRARGSTAFYGCGVRLGHPACKAVDCYAAWRSRLMGVPPMLSDSPADHSACH
jgi:hypothetical protein